MGEIWSFNAFVMLKTTFSKHWLIKISMICAYIWSLNFWKNDTTAMTATTNEACIGWSDEKDFSGGEN